jgi:hypothetical protein
MSGNPNEYAIVPYKPANQPANTPANEKTEDPSNRSSNRPSHQYQDVDPIMLIQSAVCEYTCRGQKHRRVFVKQQDEHLCE